MRSVQLQVLARSFGLSVVKNEASSRTAGVSEARIVASIAGHGSLVFV